MSKGKDVMTIEKQVKKAVPNDETEITEQVIQEVYDKLGFRTEGDRLNYQQRMRRVNPSVHANFVVRFGSSSEV